MKFCAYRTPSSNAIVFLMSCNAITECPDYTGYLKVEVLPSKVPVNIGTFLKSYDQFLALDDGSVQQVGTTLIERKISTLTTDTGMAIGHANTANIFTRL